MLICKIIVAGSHQSGESFCYPRFVMTEQHIVLRGEGEIAKQGKIRKGVPRLLAGTVAHYRQKRRCKSKRVLVLTQTRQKIFSTMHKVISSVLVSCKLFMLSLTPASTYFIFMPYCKKLIFALTLFCFLEKLVLSFDV